MGKHAIVIIKDKDKYLQEYIDSWKSFLFINKPQEKINCEEIKEYISKKFEINESLINCIYLDELKHRKFSEKDKKEKDYIHYFYKVDISNFKIEDKKYKWFSYDELRNDKQIWRINNDIIDYAQKVSNILRDGEEVNKSEK